jgi:hypothetical protein
MQHRKRPLAVLYIELECDRPMKRFKYDHVSLARDWQLL